MFVWLCVCVVLVPLFDSIHWNDGETLANCKFHVSYTSTMHINTWNSSANYTNRPPSNNLHNISPVESSSYFFWFVHFLRCAVIETRATSMNERTNIENHSIRPALSLAYSTDDCFVQLFANKRDNRVHIMVFYGILVVSFYFGMNGYRYVGRQDWEWRNFNYGGWGGRSLFYIRSKNQYWFINVF